jgi:DNA-binding helix-hairpin-helix protein with protein kinase domain
VKEEPRPNTETPKEQTNSDKDRIELIKLQAEADIKKSEADAIIANNNLQIKLSEANIASLEEFVKLRDTYNAQNLELQKEIASTTAKKHILDELLEKTDDLFALLQDTIKHQELVTKEANGKIELAESKLAHYTELQEKKCTDCLRRDKNKCDKCSFKIYSGRYQKDYDKWLKKTQK